MVVGLEKNGDDASACCLHVYVRMAVVMIDD